MRQDQPHNHQHPQQRGGKPLEAGPYTQIIGSNTSPTLERTIATSNKIAALIVTSGTLLIVIMIVRKWLEQNDRSRARDEALRELLGLDDEQSEGITSIPGSVTASGSFTTTGGTDLKSRIGGKKGKRNVSKSDGGPKVRSRSSSTATKMPDTGLLNTAAIQPFTSKLKAWIPRMSTSTSSATASGPSKEESIHVENLPETGPSTPKPVGEHPSEVEAIQSETQQASLSAAERKKLKKKQLRASRVRNKTSLSGSAESDIVDSPSPGRSNVSLPSASQSSEDVTRGLQTFEHPPSYKPQRGVDKTKATSESESVTPTATAHTTPKAGVRPKMAGPPSTGILGEESPTRRRDSSIGSTDDTVDLYRGWRIGSSVPSLVDAFSQRSIDSRSDSISSIPPVTPLATNVGLKIVDADLEMGKTKEGTTTRTLHEVGKRERVRRKAVGKGEVKGEKRRLLVSPPVCSIPGTSSELNLLLNMEALSGQTHTEATSVNWISEPPPCPDCEQRRREHDEKTMSPKIVEGVSSSVHQNNEDAERILNLQQQLEKAQGEQQGQNAVIQSITATNVSLSEQVAELRDQRDKSTADVQAANEQLEKLQQELGEARATIRKLQTQLDRHRENERGSEDWRRKFEHVVKEYGNYKNNTARMSDETSRNTARLEARLSEMSRMMERMQFHQQQAYPGMVPHNLNTSFPLLPAPIMLPSANSQPMPTGMGGVQPCYPHSPFMIPSPSPSPFPGHDSGSRHVSPHQPPRHRYERNPATGSGLAPNEMFNNQPTGMWALGGANANAARPPHSPSRTDISLSILKPRRASVDPSSGTTSGGERSSQVFGRVEESFSGTRPSSTGTEQQQQGAIHEIHDDAFHRQESSATGDSATTQLASIELPPVAATPAFEATSPGALQETDGPTRPLEFMFSRNSPSKDLRNSADHSPDPQAQEIAAAVLNGISPGREPAAMVVPPEEEEYDEPVFASIRPRR
ncbi:hypothetical protein QFC19_003757 [Naganishia cerealis]|uniref:Uncharacterized protein n=1 Tax=Naganishia cerealis TaxID=610337 RepID=A0ACC2W0W1_9TREE|nr:hypothetical protein QFC19_003757 [Naganishia cerealis]